MKREVFKKNGKELVPAYLSEDFPPEEYRPAKEAYLFKQKWNGERPPALAFENVVRAIYTDHLRTHSTYGKFSHAQATG
jgi:hypothetical protein